MISNSDSHACPASHTAVLISPIGHRTITPFDLIATTYTLDGVVYYYVGTSDGVAFYWPKLRELCEDTAIGEHH
jgi:hypothetical protein